MKQEKWAYTSIESIEETEQEITVDAQRHSNSPRNPFEKHFWMRMYRNCIYGALTMFETLSVWGHSFLRKKRHHGRTYLYLDCASSYLSVIFGRFNGNGQNICRLKFHHKHRPYSTSLVNPSHCPEHCLQGWRAGRQGLPGLQPHAHLHLSFV